MTGNIQAPILSTSRDPATARLRVSATSRQELQIAQGRYFVGATERTGLLVSDPPYNSVLKAAADKYLVIEDALIESDFQGAAVGTFSLNLQAYVKGSNGNAWGYTVGAPIPVGRPLNAGSINDLPTSTIDRGVTVASPALSGDPDYPLFFVDYYVETLGNRATISSTGADFFAKGRQIIIPPGGELLIQTVVDGTSAGTMSLKSIFFTSEIDIADVPSVLGYTP